jgi:hypothetical protein
MQKLIYLGSILIFGSFLTLAKANNDPTKLNLNGEEIQVQQIAFGKLKLFVNVTKQQTLVEAGFDFYTTEEQEIERFFISENGFTEEVTPGNFKRLIHKYMPNAPDLHKRLGKQGFRFENLPQMITFYNKFRTEKSL